VKALETGEKVLAKEFWLVDLLSESSALQIDWTPELLTALSERISIMSP
jgi:hypothetical protein